jgi:CheY-like chemotaxis protein
MSGERRTMRLLVVDDDKVMRQLFSVVLQRAGFEVDFAEDGQMGVEMWEKGNYDLILMDVQMPRLNGLDATIAIRGRERAKGLHTPIVAVTAFALQKDEAECLSAGMDAYLAKPINFKKCVELIHSLAA